MERSELTREMVEVFMRDLNKIDLEEVTMFGGDNGVKSEIESIMNYEGRLFFLTNDNHKLEVVAGIDRFNRCWMMTTEALSFTNKKRLWKMCETVLGEYENLTCFIYHKNIIHVKLVESLGFRQERDDGYFLLFRKGV